MAVTYKRLGAITGSGTITTPGTVYTAASVAGTSTVVSTVAICNTASTSATYRLGVSTTSAFEQSGYLVFGATVAANDSIFLTLGITLDPTNEFLLASTSASTVSISAFGVENS
jgi:hypothetical protein